MARRRFLGTTLAALTLLAASACGGDDDPLAGDDSGSDDGGDKGSLVIGGQDFYELQIMASMYKLLLEDAGYTVETLSLIHI